MKLLIEDDQGNRSVVPVIRDEITIGRKEGNTIRLTERNVSRHHARLVRKNGTLFVEDVEARYGVKKNGQEIDDRAEFSEGDVVLIGDYRLTLRPEQATSADPPDANGAAHTEISPELQEEETKVKGVDEVEGAPDADSSPDQETESEPAESGPETQVVEAEPAELVVVSSNFAGQKFPLDREEMVIGRGEECDIIIDHRSVSNTHAKVIREAPETYKIVDLNSRNGVKVSGEEYKSVHLERGDIVELGHVKFRFVEPDENYVFEPSEAKDSDVEVAPSSSSINPVAVFGVAVLVVAVFGGAFLVIASGNGGNSGSTIEEKATAKAGASADSAEVTEEEREKARTERKVVETISQAKKDIKAGNLEKAIGALESTKNLLEPSPKQATQIDTLLSTARNEQPFRRRYDSARQAVSNENYRSALEDLDKIPDHSVFADLVEKNDVKKKALKGLFGAAEKKVEKEEYEEAKKQLEFARQFEGKDKRAKELLDQIEEEQRQKTVAAQRTGSREPTSSGSGDETESTGSPASTTQQGGAPEETEEEPESSGVSQADAERLFREATKKWIRGDHRGALTDCRQAIRAGYTDCFRVMGMANKQLGNTDAACRNFKRYLSADPSDGAKIRGVMDEMGCP